MQTVVKIASCICLLSVKCSSAHLGNCCLLTHFFLLMLHFKNSNLENGVAVISPDSACFAIFQEDRVRGSTFTSWDAVCTHPVHYGGCEDVLWESA